MKKILPAFLLILCLICGIAAAETASDVTVLNWSDAEETLKANLPGKIVEMDNYTFKYYEIDSFTKQDNPDFEFFYQNQEGYTYAAQVVEFEEDALGAFYNEIVNNPKFDTVNKASLNGYDAIIYRSVQDQNNPVACCSIEVEGGKLMTFYFGPARDENEFAVAVAVFTGIQ